MRCVIWGAGKCLYNARDRIDWDDIVCITDKQLYYDDNNLLMGRFRVIDEIDFENVDYVIVSSTKYFDEISSALIYVYGVSISRIISIQMYLAIKENEFEAIKQISSKYLYRLLIETHFEKGEFETTSLLERGNELCGFRVIRRFDNQNAFLMNVHGTLLSNNSCKTTKTVFCVTHKKYVNIQMDGYTPIRAGAVYSYDPLYRGDDTGDSISHLNPIINECTAMYWIWKNTTLDIVGIVHYRRYFESIVNKGWPIQLPEIECILANYDIIVGERHDSFFTVIEGLKDSVDPVAFDKSFAVLSSIFEKRKEQILFNKVMNGYVFYKCNMIITSKAIYDEYCDWLFPIAFEMVEKIEIDPEWDKYSQRIIAFWLERLLTVWLLMKDYTIRELPIILTDDGKPYGK